MKKDLGNAAVRSLNKDCLGTKHKFGEVILYVIKIVYRGLWDKFSSLVGFFYLFSQTALLLLSATDGAARIFIPPYPAA